MEVLCIGRLFWRVGLILSIFVFDCKITFTIVQGHTIWNIFWVNNWLALLTGNNEIMLTVLQAEQLAKDLQLFAQHANRKSVNMEDVILSGEFHHVLPDFQGE